MTKRKRRREKITESPALSECECGKECSRHSEKVSTRQSLTTDIEVKRGVYYCSECNKYFVRKMPWLFDGNSRYTNEVKKKICRLVERNNYTYEAARKEIKDDYGLDISVSSICTWVSERKLKE